MKTLCREFLRFIYPSRCLYCDEEVDLKHLCEKCITSLKLSYHMPEEREVYCFEQVSSAKALLKRYESTQYKKLGQLILSFMVVKFVNMGWEMPDVVISGVKEEASFYKSNDLNCNLAKAFAKSLNLSYDNVFKYTLSDRVYDEKGSLEGEVRLTSKSFLEGKKILIIQDEITSLSKTYRELLPEALILTFLSEEKQC